MEVIYFEFTRCDFSGGWDYSESDVKTYYEVKSEPATVDIWSNGGKKENYKFKKGAMVRITNNIIRINKEDIK